MHPMEHDMTNHLPVIGQTVKDLSFEVYHEGKIKKLSFAELRGRWVILFFYPADFTFVCPTELEDVAENYARLRELHAEVVSVSRDTVFVHKAWHDNSPTIKKIAFPMAADPTGMLSREFGVYIPSEGVSLRGTFIIDPDGILKAFEVHDNSIGRSATELIRKLEAAQYVREHGGEVCPANWKPGAKTLKPGLDLVGKI